MVHPLSAVIITHNEERNIGRCLASLREVADDIVVVDDFSTDQTEAICQKYGVRFFQKKWEGYSAQKNYANALATHDFILSLDADEALSEELKQAILKAKEKGLQGAYSFNRLTNWCGHWIHHCGWQPDWKLRIWDRRMGQWEGLIHETVQFAEKVPVTRLQGQLLHYSYYHISEHIRQADTFTDLIAREAYEKGKRSSWWKILFAPPVKFLQNYFLDLGFMDGSAGFMVCRINAFVTFLKYSKLHDLGHRRDAGA